MKKRSFENVKDSIGKIIQLHRMRKNLSQFQIASEIGVSSNQIGRIERGETNPTIEILFKICDYLNVDFSEVFLPITEQKLKEIVSEIHTLRSLKKSKSK